MFLMLIFRLAIFLLVSFSASAFLVPDGTDYQVAELKYIRVIYSEDSQPFLQRLILMEDKIIQEFERTYRWNMLDKLTVILASDNNQVANAFSTPFPRNVNTFYNGGGALLDYFSMQSWIFSLISHEGAHAYQLDVKQDLSKIYYSFFGSSPMPHILVLLPIFTNPNFLLPSFLIEGNAVFNESRFGNGGRLFSGEARALHCSLIKDKKINENRLTNNHLDFPYMQEKYIVGGYFFNFLYERFGIEKVNSFFLEQSTHWINPFIVNSTFKRHFGQSYSDLIEEFAISEYSNLCHKQKRTEVKAFATSAWLVPLTDDNTDVWSLVTSGKKTPKLMLVNKNDELIKLKVLDLDSEKIFKLNEDEFVSLDSKLIKQRIQKFSLWDESGKEIKKYRGKILNDLRGGDYLWISPKESMDEPILYHNDKKIGVTHSQAKFDHNLNIYRFVQNKEDRTLYKNDEPLFTFKSFYSKVADIDETGRVYFIASTQTGSSLFYYENDKYYRAINSDAIVDARKLKNHFLIIEVSSSGYEYKIVTLDFVEENPTFYDYKFKEHDEFKTYANLPKSNEAEKIEIVSEDYSMFRHLQYQGGNSYLSLAGSDFIGSLSIGIADPLDYHQFMVTGTLDRFSGKDTVMGTYMLNKYLWDYFIYQAYERKYPTGENPQRLKDHDQESGAGIIIPLIENKYHQLKTLLSSGYEVDEKLHTGYGLMAYRFLRHYGLSLFAYRSLDAQVEHELKSDGEFESSFWSKFTTDIKDETYVSIDTLLKSTNHFELPLSDIKSLSSTPIASAPYSFYSLDDTKKSLRAGLELKKTINESVYFKKFPISLRRFAPKVLSHYFYYTDRNRSGNFYEVGAGITFDLLLGHLAPLPLSINYITREFDENHIIFETGVSF